MKKERERVLTCLFCHLIYDFLSENSVREIQHSNSNGIKRVSILFPTFPTMALRSPLLVLMSMSSEIYVELIRIGEIYINSKQNQQTSETMESFLIQDQLHNIFCGLSSDDFSDKSRNVTQ